MKTMHFQHVYVQSSAVSGALKEQDGPLGSAMDVVHRDLYCGMDNYEQAERKLLKEACVCALKKNKMHFEDVDLFVGGDLLNQLMSCHYFVRNLQVPFIGMYAACATSSLLILNAGTYIEQGFVKNALVFTSSHNACAERQFRFPNEYGIQKKSTTTYTVSGAGAILLGSKKSIIKVASCTIGRVIDWDFTNANDMGRAMAPAAFDTICHYFNDTKESFSDFDYVLTGDLSTLGLQFLKDMFIQSGIHDVENLYDCGCCIYDVDRQDVFCGGSGSACSISVSIAKVFKELETKKAKRVMVVSTGALLSKVAIAQKESIPCIAHAVVYERVDEG